MLQNKTSSATLSIMDADADASTKTQLEQAGLRVTPVRREVLAALTRVGYPLAQAELAALRGLKSFDRVTLYRTLSRLKEAGLVHAVQGMDGAWRFCAHPVLDAGCPGNHPHFLCLGCGRMRCLTGQKLPHVRVPPDVEVQGKQLVVYGLCSGCGAAGRADGEA
jgi:Fur family ferric uptake transcriptional regulator